MRPFEKSIESAIWCKLSINSRNVENKPTSNENKSDSPRVGRNGWEREEEKEMEELKKDSIVEVPKM